MVVRGGGGPRRERDEEGHLSIPSSENLRGVICSNRNLVLIENFRDALNTWHEQRGASFKWLSKMVHSLFGGCSRIRVRLSHLTPPWRFCSSIHFVGRGKTVPIYSCGLIGEGNAIPFASALSSFYKSYLIRDTEVKWTSSGWKWSSARDEWQAKNKSCLRGAMHATTRDWNS